MRRIIAYFFGLLAIGIYCAGLYALIGQPLKFNATNTLLFICCFIMGGICTLIFVMLAKTLTGSKKKLKCKGRPELSNMKVEMYGDEKLLIDGNDIINL